MKDSHGSCGVSHPFRVLRVSHRFRIFWSATWGRVDLELQYVPVSLQFLDMYRVDFGMQRIPHRFLWSERFDKRRIKYIGYPQEDVRMRKFYGMLFLLFFLIPVLGFQNHDQERWIILLTDQPFMKIKENVEKRYWKEREAFERIQKEFFTVLRQDRGTGIYSREREDSEIMTKHENRIRELAHLWEQYQNKVQQEVIREVRLRILKEQEELKRWIEKEGGQVFYQYTVVNGMAIRAGSSLISRLEGHPLVLTVFPDEKMKADLDISVPSIGTGTWWTNGMSGYPSDVGIIDTGMDQTHPAFSLVSFVSHVFHTTAVTDSCYADNPNSTDDYHFHGTHVGGIVVSQGSSECTNCQGVAKGLDLAINLKAGFLCSDGYGYMYWSDMMAAVDWAEALTDTPDVYNLSYGGETNQDDSGAARFWDAVVYSLGDSVAISAGNSGPSNLFFTSPGHAYNVLTVANMNDQDTVDRADDVIESTSTRGPTAYGRKKPDISAPGTSIQAPFNRWETFPDYVYGTGTSMAAPHVAGAMALVRTLITDPLCVKALLINSADAWSDGGTPENSLDDGPVNGSHWDKTYGWGYINLDHAYYHTTDVYQSSLTTSCPYHYYRGYVLTYDKATLTWYRRAIYNGTSVPTTYYTLSDLNLNMYRASDMTLIASSSSSIDNVEQLHAPETNEVFVQVALSGFIDGATYESYCLALEENFTDVGPVPNPYHVSPADGSTLTELAPTLKWTSISQANSYDVQVCLDPGCTNVVRSKTSLSSNQWDVSPALTPGSTYYWRVRSNSFCGSSSWTSAWSFTIPPMQTLQVSLSGSGSGTVRSTPSGITCGSTCSDQFIKGTEIVLRAEPDPGSVFAGWSGDADCSDGVIVLTTDVSCIASFNTSTLYPSGLVVDGAGNGVFEPGETVSVIPQWTNTGSGSITLTGVLNSFTGPSSGVYSLIDTDADYGTLLAGESGDCETGSGNCYSVHITGTRPDLHWDALLTEATGAGPSHVWALHIGQSFSDVASTSGNYRHVETMLHYGITSGCGGTSYCPTTTVGRGMMAVFVARAMVKEEPPLAYTDSGTGLSYDCGDGLPNHFSDVDDAKPYCAHVHYLWAKGVVVGCGSNTYCPKNQVTRGQMAVYISTAMYGGQPPSIYTDPETGRSYDCTDGNDNYFLDVPDTAGNCAHVHYLWARGVIVGCGLNTYCPTQLVTRGQMAVYIVNGFQFPLYAP